MLSIMLLATWTTSGTMMLIFLAALQDIPAQLHEAASVDGATRWQQFRKITLPLLRPTTFFIITIGIISTFQVFDQVYVISDGGPAGTTNTVAWIAYRNAFKDSLAGLGAATAFTLFVIVMIFTFVQRRLLGRANR
jgi:multiple sugar transport system permease protein